jgi:acyl-CoA synthetase (AMP-forming)/AMP-acid ligase II
MQGWIHVIEWRANVHPRVTALTDDRGSAYTYAGLLAAGTVYIHAAFSPAAVVDAIEADQIEFSGYWRDLEATAAAFAEGGWYRTGDIARLTPDGYLYILDRARDMIISGGENIYPAEVEAVLARHPAVADVAVLGRPDPVWGEAVHAVIIPAAGPADGDEIISWCRGQLAHFKCPKSVEFAAALPRTTTGKVLTRELRGRLAAPGETGPVP